MATVIVAVLGVFMILSVWVTVDLLARRQLGERQHGCTGPEGLHGHHHRHGGPQCAGCQALEACQKEDDADE